MHVLKRFEGAELDLDAMEEVTGGGGRWPRPQIYTRKDYMISLDLELRDTSVVTVGNNNVIIGVGSTGSTF